MQAEFVIPTDFETRLSSQETLRDPLAKDLLLIPPGDLSLTVQKRDSRIQIQATKKVLMLLIFIP